MSENVEQSGDPEMKQHLLVVLAAVPLLAAPLTAQTSADSAGIRAAALDYAEGWYNADGDRMARALHPELAKRVQFSDSTGATWIRTMGATELIRGAKSGGGKSTPADKQRKDVKILDVFQKAASVRVDMSGWIDYLQLVKWNGRWVILNVLWEVRDKT
jgi:hypothetical protein